MHLDHFAHQESNVAKPGRLYANDNLFHIHINTPHLTDLVAKFFFTVLINAYGVYPQNSVSGLKA